MSLLGLRAYWKLIYFDFYLARGEFSSLRHKVHSHPTARMATEPERVGKICAAVDRACIWYPKQVFCLQRSAATACLLKSSGVAAEMVIGAQQVPFKAHAWVEVDGRVVNDRPYMREMYLVLDRC